MAVQDVPLPQRQSRHVLILDFDAATLIALEQVLEDAGFDTTTTWNMHEACLWLGQKRFDAIVVGDHPPIIDARAVLRRLEGLHRLIPCFVMRAPPGFSTEPQWTRLVTIVSGCSCSEVLGKVHQRLDPSTSIPHTPVADHPPEPILLKRMWEENHAQ
jgi:response regulator RpfG family c-di-GMP phosphodiesterase